MLTSISPNSYQPKTSDQNTQAMADLLPRNKKLWATANVEDTTLRTLLKALSLEMGRYQNLLYQVVSEYIPNLTNSLIERWEEALGIPDDCFLNTGSDDERRRNILIKLAYMNLQTDDDYYALAALLGLDIQIYYAEDLDQFPYTFPIPFTEGNNLFVWYINISNVQISSFPYTFPISFGTSAVGLFQCICLKQKPANTELIFTYDPLDYVDGNGNQYVDGNNARYTTG